MEELLIVNGPGERSLEIARRVLSKGWTGKLTASEARALAGDVVRFDQAAKNLLAAMESLRSRFPTSGQDSAQEPNP